MKDAIDRARGLVAWALTAIIVLAALRVLLNLVFTERQFEQDFSASAASATPYAELVIAGLVGLALALTLTLGGSGPLGIARVLLLVSAGALTFLAVLGLVGAFAIFAVDDTGLQQLLGFLARLAAVALLLAVALGSWGLSRTSEVIHAKPATASYSYPSAGYTGGYGGQPHDQHGQDAPSQQGQGQGASQGAYAAGPYPPSQYAQPGQYPAQYPATQYPPAAQYGQGQYAQGQYGQVQFAPGQFGPGAYGPGQFGPGQYASSHQGPGDYGQGQHGQGQYGQGQHGQGQYGQGQYGEGAYATGQPEPARPQAPGPQYAPPGQQQEQYEQQRSQGRPEYRPVGSGGATAVSKDSLRTDAPERESATAGEDSPGGPEDTAADGTAPRRE